MKTSRGSTRSRSRGSEPPRLPRLRPCELSSRSRGSSPQRESSSTGHLRQKRQRVRTHAAAQQSCRYSLLRALDLNPLRSRRTDEVVTEIVQCGEPAPQTSANRSQNQPSASCADPHSPTLTPSLFQRRNARSPGIAFRRSPVRFSAFPAFIFLCKALRVVGPATSFVYVGASVAPASHPLLLRATTARGA